MPRHRRPRVNRHFKIDHELAPGDRDAYLAHLREPRTTIDLAHAWLVEKGYRTFSRSAVARHRRHYLETRQRREDSAHAAMQFAHLAKSGELSAEGLILGMAAQSETLLFNAMLDRPGKRQKLTFEELDELGELVSRMVTTRKQVFELEQQIEAAKGRGPLTRPEDQAEQAKPQPAPTPEAEHEAMIRRVCEILEYPYAAPGARANDVGPGGAPSDN